MMQQPVHQKGKDRKRRERKEGKGGAGPAIPSLECALDPGVQGEGRSAGRWFDHCSCHEQEQSDGARNSEQPTAFLC